jgi:hypothetical protein
MNNSGKRTMASAHCSLFVVHCSLFIIRCLLFIVHVFGQEVQPEPDFPNEIFCHDVFGFNG